MGAKLWILIVSVILAVPIVNAAMTINPINYEINDLSFNKTYNIVITAINPDSSIFDVRVAISQDSAYLSDYVDIDPAQFRLEPNDKKNIRLSLTVPSDLPPGEHILRLDFISAEHVLGSFKLSFTVPGEKIEDLVLERASATNATDDRLVYFDFALSNKGNVIAKGSPAVEIYSGQELVDSLGEESSILIMPGDTYNFSMMYDTTNILPGLYTYKAWFGYNGLKTDVKQGSFMVMGKKEGGSYSETREVPEGEMLTLDIPLENPEGMLSFYSIQYNMFDQGIGDTVEGEMQGKEKNVGLSIDTSALDPGSYPLDIVIRTGRNLENSREERVLVEVKSKRNLLIPGIALLFAFMVAAVFIARPFLSSRKEKRAAYLHFEITGLGKRFASTEESLKHMTQDINSFIHTSNEWLRAHGYGNYGFR